MSRASFRQADIERIIRAAAKTSSLVQVDLVTLTVTVIPGAASQFVMPQIGNRVSRANEEEDDGLESWDDSPPTSSSPAPFYVPAMVSTKRVGSGGYPILNSPDLQKVYSRIGFDPMTMTHNDFNRLQEEAHAKWKASVPGTKLTKHEISVLKRFSEIGVGKRTLLSNVKGCGFRMLDLLDARGFVGRRELLSKEEVNAGRSREEVWLLKAGQNALENETGSVDLSEPKA